MVEKVFLLTWEKLFKFKNKYPSLLLVPCIQVFIKKNNSQKLEKLNFAKILQVSEFARKKYCCRNVGVMRVSDVNMVVIKWLRKVELRWLADSYEVQALPLINLFRNWNFGLRRDIYLEF